MNRRQYHSGCSYSPEQEPQMAPTPISLRISFSWKLLTLLTASRLPGIIITPRAMMSISFTLTITCGSWQSEVIPQIGERFDNQKPAVPRPDLLLLEPPGVGVRHKHRVEPALQRRVD